MLGHDNHAKRNILRQPSRFASNLSCGIVNARINCNTPTKNEPHAFNFFPNDCTNDNNSICCISVHSECYLSRGYTQLSCLLSAFYSEHRIVWYFPTDLRRILYRWRTQISSSMHFAQCTYIKVIGSAALSKQCKHIYKLWSCIALSNINEDTYSVALTQHRHARIKRFKIKEKFRLPNWQLAIMRIWCPNVNCLESRQSELRSSE